ncbi:MAG: HAMP domain-containing protein [Nitrospirae bacterium]|nr:HAMP domain-containing protein [Nitrospirota bacterium]MBF0535525.1 HAMP domain-containing protein [Nitrospirota bacterium]MBF0617448.1 HAMP domain-containing protein [Nitrospirota bacterium]
MFNNDLLIFTKGNIRKRLMQVNLLSIGVVVIMIGLVIVVEGVISFKMALITDLTLKAKMIAKSSAAAILFSDSKRASEILKMLKYSPNIELAVLYSKEGTIFAQYEKENSETKMSPPLPREDGYFFEKGSLLVFQTITYNKNYLGTVYIRSNIKALYQNLVTKFLFGISVSSAAFLIAIFFMTKLQKSIIGPIYSILDVMNTVEAQRNYTIRAKVESDDEIGMLAHGLNEMLSQIQTWNSELEYNRRNLEELVSIRTRELAEINVKLNAELIERKRIEDELRFNTALLEDLNRTLEERVIEEAAKRTEQEKMLIQQSRLAAMGEMIGNIAHQWRQPINVISLILYKLSRAYSDNALTQEIMSTSVAKAQKLIEGMSTTIDDFRNFFKPDKVRENFYLAASVQNTVSLFDASFKNSDISVHLDVKDNGLVNGYPNEFSQALLNLFSNSKDVIIEKSIHPGLVSIQVGVNDSKAFLKFSDNGGGIPENTIDRIFEPYFTTKEQGKGTGVGLYMSKMIIENNMNGKLTVHNVDDGAEFLIELPLVNI